MMSIQNFIKPGQMVQNLLEDADIKTQEWQHDP
jgi:hypothetical protein